MKTTQIASKLIFVIVFAFLQVSLFADTQVIWEKVEDGRYDGNIRPVYSGGLSYAKPVLVDLDGDSLYDLVIGREDGKLTCYYNKGNKNSPKWERDSKSFANVDVLENSAPAFIDIDADGDLDLFVGRRNGKLSFYENGGTKYKIQIDAYFSIDVGEDSAPVFADIDSDGDYDLFIGAKSGLVAYYKNTGDKFNPSWGTGEYLPVKVSSNSTPAFSDIDNDGDYDLFIGDSNGEVTYSENTGDKYNPVWKKEIAHYNSIDVGDESSLSFADINNDKRPDLFIGEKSGDISFVKNISLKQEPVLPLGWSSQGDLVDKDGNYIESERLNKKENTAIPIFCDIDRDGYLDLFLGADYRIIHYEMDTIGRWEKKSNMYNNINVYYHCYPSFCDIDKDGDLDLFVASQTRYLYFYKNVGTPTNPVWAPRKVIHDNGGDGSGEPVATFVDINNDGTAELFINNVKTGAGRLDLYEYKYDSAQDTYTLTLKEKDYGNIVAYSLRNSFYPSFVDIDGDNDKDLFLGQFDGTIKHYRNNGTPENAKWVAVTTSYNSIDPGWIVALNFVDIDNDNDYDMFITNFTPKSRVAFYRNETEKYNPRFDSAKEHCVYLDAGYNSKPAFGDIDGDGKIDMLIGKDDGTLSYYKNNNAINPDWKLVSENYGSIDAGDYSAPVLTDIDTDGDLDLFIGNKEGKVAYYQNNGNKTAPVWGNETNKDSVLKSFDAGEYSAPSLVDIDGDSDLDMFIGEKQGKIKYLRNDDTGYGPLWNEDNIYDYIDAGDYAVPTFADIDGDYDYDMCVGVVDGKIKFYRNTGSPSYPKLERVANYESMNNIDAGSNSAPYFIDIDTDGYSDMFVGNKEGGFFFYRNNDQKDEKDEYVEDKTDEGSDKTTTTTTTSTTTLTTTSATASTTTVTTQAAATTSTTSQSASPVSTGDAGTTTTVVYTTVQGNSSGSSSSKGASTKTNGASYIIIMEKPVTSQSSSEEADIAVEESAGVNVWTVSYKRTVLGDEVNNSEINIVDENRLAEAPETVYEEEYEPVIEDNSNENANLWETIKRDNNINITRDRQVVVPIPNDVISPPSAMPVLGAEYTPTITAMKKEIKVEDTTVMEDICKIGRKLIRCLAQ